MKESEINEIHKEVVALLKAFGYKPEVKVNHPSVGYIDICFPVKNWFETMPTRHKDAISMLAKGYLRSLREMIKCAGLVERRHWYRTLTELKPIKHILR